MQSVGFVFKIEKRLVLRSSFRTLDFHVTLTAVLYTKNAEERLVCENRNTKNNILLKE